MTDIKQGMPNQYEVFLQKDGTVSKVWYNFLFYLFQRLGSGTSNLDITGTLTHSGSQAGFLGVSPTTQQSKINDPAGGGTIDAQARTAINSIIDVLEGFGFSSDT